MMVKNPFKYGEPVIGEDFTDRESECKEIAHDLYSGQNIILYSPRRLGKTSLIIEIEKRLKERLMSAPATLTSSESFPRKNLRRG